MCAGAACSKPNLEGDIVLSAQWNPWSLRFDFPTASITSGDARRAAFEEWIAEELA